MELIVDRIRTCISRRASCPTVRRLRVQRINYFPFLIKVMTPPIIFKHTCEIAVPKFHALLQELTQRIVSAANNVFKYGGGTRNRTQIERVKAAYSTIELHLHGPLLRKANLLIAFAMASSFPSHCKSNNRITWFSNINLNLHHNIHYINNCGSQQVCFCKLAKVIFSTSSIYYKTLTE